VEQRQALLIYEFADFRLDAQRRVLSSRIDGQPIQVTGKVIDTLVYFVEHAGVLLDKQTLLAALWPNVVVEESNLTQTMHTLRRVLGERPGEHRFIVTVPGRGYRFVADVTRPASEDPAPLVAPEQSIAERPVWPRARIWVASLIAGTVIVTGLSAFLLRTRPDESEHAAGIVASMPAVAVLPFVDMSEAHNQAYFADGLSEEILNLLAQSAAMSVIARTSSFSFKDHPDMDIAMIAHKLRATHVLEGSVRKSGEHVRITAQLVDGATSAHLWSRTYDREVTDIFSVQDDIAAAVTAALNATLSNGHQPQQADTTSAVAFEDYLHGKYFFNRGGESDVMRGKEYFEQALHVDPNYARAWVGLAGIYTALSWRQAPDQTMQREWLQSIERGLSLGPGLAEAHVRAAQYYWWLGDWGTSEEHCKVAIALNPSDALVLTVSALKDLAIGHRLEALSLQRRAVAVDPLSADGHDYLGLYLAAVGEFEEAEKELRDARELSPTLPGIDVDIAKVLVMRKRFDEAIAMLKPMPASPSRDQGLALAYYGKGNLKAADEALGRLDTLAKQPDASAHKKIYVAEVHAFRGDAEQALTLIESAVGPASSRQMAASMIDAIQVVHRSPFFIPLHTQARWHALFPDQVSFGKTAGA
jgi:TolB-like protein/DNA-binding winged helix-turn-helix (wHTH) protein/tetratricopeptide (TPR) repeat protein